MWNDFNSAEEQNSFDLIPAGTIAPVRMTIKPGGFDDPNQGWTGGYATRNDETGAVYLNCEFVILEGEFAKRKVWSLIGLHSNKGPDWQNMGRSFIRGILNSANKLSDKDNSPQAQNARRIKAIADLDGISFVAKIDQKKDQNGQMRNEIRYAVTLENPEYNKHAGSLSAPANTSQTATQGNAAPSTNRPHWAQ